MTGGKEFLVHVIKNDLIEKGHVIKSKCATKANPHENLILEIIYEVIANLVRIYDLKIIT